MGGSNTTLTTQAQQLVGKQLLTADMSVGNVACVIKSKSGQVYTGLNVKAAADLGWCAEVSAINQMILAGETNIDLIVSINDDDDVIPPCGRCRELMYQLDRANLKAEIIVDDTKTIPLSDLLPERWQTYWSGRDEA